MATNDVFQLRSISTFSKLSNQRIDWNREFENQKVVHKINLNVFNFTCFQCSELSVAILWKTWCFPPDHDLDFQGKEGKCGLGIQPVERQKPESWTNLFKVAATCPPSRFLLLSLLDEVPYWAMHVCVTHSVRHCFVQERPSALSIQQLCALRESLFA